MRRIFNALILLFIGLTLSCTADATRIIAPETQFSITYPSAFDANECDQTPFSGSLQSLALPNIPLSSIISNLTQDPVMNNYSLEIKLIQQTLAFANIKIIGDKNVLKHIEDNMANGIETKLTEFPRCVQSDPTIQLIDLVNFTPSLKNLAPSLNAKIEYIKKNEQGICATVASKSLSELVMLYHPEIDLSSIEANVSITPYGWGETGSLVAKTIQITFNKKNSIWDQLTAPKINISLPRDFVYTAIDQLHNAASPLKMTAVTDCIGEQAGEPIGIYDLTIL